MDEQRIRDLAEPDEQLRFVLDQHTSTDGDLFCPACRFRDPCDTASLAATGLARSADVAALRELVRRLVGALKDWHAHSPGCSGEYGYPCKCGLVESIALRAEARGVLGGEAGEVT